MRKLSHEDHLDHFERQHNAGLAAKEAGDKSKARVHFRARDKHFAHYVQKAPIEHVKNIDSNAVKHILSIHEGWNPIQKVKKLLQKGNSRDRTAEKMGGWKKAQSQHHQVPETKTAFQQQQQKQGK